MDERVIWAVSAIFLMVVLVQVARWWRYTLPRDRFVEGRVRRISDGDGLEFQFPSRGTRRVRLAYVDAPEFDLPWGAEARDALSRLVGGVGGRVVEPPETRYDVLRSAGIRYRQQAHVGFSGGKPKPPAEHGSDQRSGTIRTGCAVKHAIPVWIVSSQRGTTMSETSDGHTSPRDCHRHGSDIVAPTAE